MPHKIHLKGSKAGLAVCAMRAIWVLAEELKKAVA
jgi:hypothetical protein